MRVLLAFDVLDDATKKVVRILSDAINDEKWRLDTYDVSEIGAMDIARSQLMVIGGTTSTSIKNDELTPVSPSMLDFLDALDEVDMSENIRFARSVAAGVWTVEVHHGVAALD